MQTGFGGERDHLENLDVDGANIKMDLRAVGWGHGLH
jgi:hypothetical protein